jgi:hypothetical protein
VNFEPTETDEYDESTPKHFPATAEAIGVRVIDRDQPEGERTPARIVDAPGTRACEHEIAAIGKTVAEVNPDRYAGAAVLGIQFEDADGAPNGATYHYPAPRLEPVSEDWDPDNGEGDR